MGWCSALASALVRAASDVADLSDLGFFQHFPHLPFLDLLVVLHDRVALESSSLKSLMGSIPG